MLHFGWPGCLNLYNENPLCCLPQIEVRDRREPRYGVQRLHWGQQWHWKPSLLFSSLLFSSLLFSSLLSPICFSEFSSLLVPSLLSSPMIRISPTFNADTKCTGFCKIKTTTTTTTTTKNTGINYILKKKIIQGCTVHLTLSTTFSTNTFMMKKKEKDFTVFKVLICVRNSTPWDEEP